MDVTLAIVSGFFTLILIALAAWVFIWAARKDGEHDKELQTRLGIRRRTRL